MSMMGDDTSRDSAFDLIEEYLNLLDLGNLKDLVTDLVFEQGITNGDLLKFEIRRTQEYQQRFRGNQLRLQNGFTAIDEQTYLQLERTYAEFFRNSGLPSTFYDNPDDFTNFIANNISTNELQQRVSNGYEAVAFADPEVKRQMNELYGVGENELAAFFLDPERARPILMRKAQAAQAAAGAFQSGQQLSQEEAEMLALEGVGLQEARAGFDTVAQAQELFQTTTGEQSAGEQDFTRQEQIGAAFGTSGAAQQRLRQRTRRRQAQFEQGGRFAGQGAELTGLQ